MPRAELSELAELSRILEAGAAHLDVRRLCEVEVEGQRFPVLAAILGSTAPEAPAVGFFGGVHGLERIGTQVMLAFLATLVARLPWDELLQEQLSRVRLLFVPIVNPGGMWRGTRANPNGVDIMRNAPVECSQRVAFPIGGHRVSARLPFYRGLAGAPMEAETRAICDLVESEMLARPFSIALDCHSGFGVRDRIWFPHAHTRFPFPDIAEVHALLAMFDSAYPHHNYLFEPQCKQYLTHGDVWDYLYLRSRTGERRVFLPLTLEMGSWLWIKKSPRQILSRVGMFNPIAAHRQQRVLRSHLTWLEFLCRSAPSYRKWLPQGADRAGHERAALATWFQAGA
jgi:Zinc carboxypeptidase